ncbi:MAG TPA: DnaJ domain-containing protein [Myxococcaceae bacterium]|nr:DnaJ domain-containing protein [Myxococcaceae bacterium]
MRETDKIPGLGGPKDFIAPLPRVDPSRLTVEERRVLDCVSGASMLGDVLSRTGMEEQKAIQLLLSLRLKGAIGPASGPVSRPAPPVGRGAAPSFAAELAEAVDLDAARKQEILEREHALEGMNHFDVLELEPGATSEDVKRAFYELSKRFHPDRYFGKQLGSYKGRLERIFRRLSEAHTVLSDPNRREAYLKEHPELSFELPDASGASDDPESQARAAERRARMARHPYLLQPRKVNELMAEAKAAIDKGDFDRAVSHLTTLTRVDPRNKDAPTLLRDVRRKQEIARGQREIDEAKRAELEGDYARAALAYKAASNGDPQNALAAAKAAQLMIRMGEDAKQAKPFAQRAVDLEPNNPSYRVLLGRILLEAGLKRLAKKEYEKALALEPGNAEAKEQVRKLRWAF